MQHQDGSSHLVAATVPNCRAYDPAFAGELAVIIDHGARQMLEARADVFYYITVMNENYSQPALSPEARQGIIRGMYRFGEHHCERARGKVRLLGSGAILRETIAAAQMLKDEWQIAAEVWSVTSYSELAREAREVERWNRLQPREQPRVSHVSECLAGEAREVQADVIGRYAIDVDAAASWQR